MPSWLWRWRKVTVKEHRQPLKSRKSRQMDSPSSFQKEHSSANTLTLAQWGSRQTSDFQNCKIINLCDWKCGNLFTRSRKLTHSPFILPKYPKSLVRLWVEIMKRDWKVLQGGSVPGEQGPHTGGGWDNLLTSLIHRKQKLGCRVDITHPHLPHGIFRNLKTVLDAPPILWWGKPIWSKSKCLEFTLEKETKQHTSDFYLTCVIGYSMEHFLLYNFILCFWIVILLLVIIVIHV